jgi:hypothetical protein
MGVDLVLLWPTTAYLSPKTPPLFTELFIRQSTWQTTTAFMGTNPQRWLEVALAQWFARLMRPSDNQKTILRDYSWLILWQAFGVPTNRAIDCRL